MKNIFSELKYFLLYLKEKERQKKFQKHTKSTFKNKTSKQVLGSAADLTINSTTLKIIDDVKENVSAIVKQTNCDPEKLLEYIRLAKTPVYRIDNADKYLNYIKEEEGLICEKQGLEAIFLSLLTNQGLKFKTEPMFVLRNGIIDKFYMLHHFFRWYSLKSDLPGFEADTQKLFKIFLMNNSTDNLMKSLSLEEIISLKEAIDRKSVV